MYKLLNLLTFIWLVSILPSQAGPMTDKSVNLIIDWHKEQCLADQPTTKENNIDIEAAFKIGTDSVYELNIDRDLQATVVYKSFTCKGYGSYWCGSGGCGFFIVVGEQIFYRSLSYKPAAINLQNDQNTSAVVFGLHGINCVGANGSSFFGFETCYVLMIWNERERTFQSITPSVKEVVLVDNEWVPVANLK